MLQALAAQHLSPHGASLVVSDWLNPGSPTPLYTCATTWPIICSSILLAEDWQDINKLVEGATVAGRNKHFVARRLT
jgi:hypothetical protein